MKTLLYISVAVLLLASGTTAFTTQMFCLYVTIAFLREWWSKTISFYKKFRGITRESTVFVSFFGDKRWQWWAYGGMTAQITLIILDVAVMYCSNFWLKGIFDTLAKGPGPDGSRAEFWLQLLTLFGIIFLYVGIPTTSGWVGRRWAANCRKASTESNIKKIETIKDIPWEQPEEIGQRIEQGTTMFINMVWNLSMQGLKHFLVLVVMGPLLWKLSENAAAPLDFPGSLLLIAVAFNIVVFKGSKRLGYKLPDLNYEKQNVNSVLRNAFSEGRTKQEKQEALDAVIQNEFAFARHLAFLEAWQNWTGQLPPNMPILFVGMNVYTRKVSLGTFPQVAQAFVEVNNAMAFIPRSWTAFAELKSVWQRLIELDESFKTAFAKKDARKIKTESEEEKTLLRQTKVIYFPKAA